MRILVVEDDFDFGNTVAEHMDSLGHEVRVANNAPQALALIDTFRPDLVFIDIGLPIFDGNSVAAAIREHATPCPRLIALTSVIDTADAELFDARVQKPATVGEAASVMSSVLTQFAPPAADESSDDAENTPPR
jgi:two-component system, OmpR family, response regulator